MSATVDKLVAHLEEDHAAGTAPPPVRTHVRRPCLSTPLWEWADTTFVTDFLLLFRTFMTPAALMAQLLVRCVGLHSMHSLPSPY
jgi:hypothetical protein